MVQEAGLPPIWETAIRGASSVCAMCQGIGESGHPRERMMVEGASYPRVVDFTPWYDYVYVHYPNLMLLKKSALDGCQVCAFLLRILMLRDNRDAQDVAELDAAWLKAEEEERTRDEPFDFGRDTIEVALLVEKTRTQKEYEYTNYNLLHRVYGRHRVVLNGQVINPTTFRNGDVVNSLFVWVPFGKDNSIKCGPINCHNTSADLLQHESPPGAAQDLLSESHLTLVRRWMETCAAAHETCRAHLGQEKVLPTRVLGISSDPATGEITHLRLVETQGSKGKYACLSYCWGPSIQESRTTTANLAQYRDSICLDSLPNTISDALRVCSKLGIHYFWVDSLCIVQDDREDWLREASGMAEIYSGSNLTLAVNICEDSSESFLSKRQRLEPGPQIEDYVRMAYTDNTTGEEKFMHLLWNRVSTTMSFTTNWTVPYSLKEDVPGMSWLSRAWTFQEWYLSPRILHIHQMTLWDCFETYGNELEHRILLRNQSSRTPSQMGADVTWATLVKIYTSRMLTKDMDKLAALAGLAEQYKKVTGQTYLAGLWLETLPSSLLWCRFNSSGPFKSPTAYRAPSWSWASLDGPVSFQFHDNAGTVIREPTVLSAHCEYDPPGTLSTVTSGWLAIEGAVSHVTSKKVRDSDLEFTNLFAGATSEGTDEGWRAVLDQDTCSDQDIAENKIFLLRIIVVEPETGGDEHALVLQEAPQDDGRDTFQRLGTAWRIYWPYEDLDRPVTDKEREQWEKRTIRLV